MRLRIPKASLPLSTVSEGTLESQAAGEFRSPVSEGPRGGGRQGHRPTPLAELPVSFVGSPLRELGCSLSFLSSSHGGAQHGGAEARAPFLTQVTLGAGP